MGGPKGWGPKKKVANVKICVIFEVFAFCSGRTKTDFKDRACTLLLQIEIPQIGLGAVLDVRIGETNLGLYSLETSSGGRKSGKS